MRLFIYEYTSAVGVGNDPLAQKLRSEGWAMLSAVLEDFGRIPGVEVTTLLADAHQPTCANVCRYVIHPTEEEEVFRKVASTCDYTLVIAPECDGLLEARLGWLAEAG